MSKLFRCFLAVWVVLSAPAFAVQVSDLYLGEVAVASQGKEDFEDAAKKALLAVLIKTSGNTAEAITSEPRIAQDLHNASTMVERFSYRKNNEQLYLRAKFPELHVLQLLQKGGLKLWPPNRPNVLVLPVVQVSSQKTLYSNNYRGREIKPMLTHASEKFGLPLTLVEQSLGESTEALWSFEPGTLNQYKQHSKTDAVYGARVAKLSNGDYIGAWYFYDGEGGKLFDVGAKTLAGFFDKGAQKLAKHLASQYSLRLTSAHNEQLLIIEGVANEQDYQALLEYLNKHHLIDTVYLLEANSAQLQLSLVLKADVAQLRKTLSLDNKLRVVANSNDLLLHYKWQ